MQTTNSYPKNSLNTTVNDIASAAGVSRRTVLRALHGKDRVSSVTKANVLRIAKEMNYRPNTIAQSLTRGKSDLVGIVGVGDLLATFQRYIEPIESRLAKHGYSLLFYTSSADPTHEKACLQGILEKRVAGAIVAPGSFYSNLEAYNELLDMGIKLVLIDRNMEDLKVPQFIANPYQSARLATDYLIGLGHRRIMHLAIPEIGAYIGRERARGFREAMAAAGIPTPDSSTVTIEMDEVAAAKTVTEILQRKERPTALLVRHDVPAIGAMRAIIAAGLSIPKDISIVGSGDMWPGDMFRVPLTTIRHPNKQIAKNAINCLLKMIDGESVEPGTRLIDVELVIRESCCPPLSD